MSFLFYCIAFGIWRGRLDKNAKFTQYIDVFFLMCVLYIENEKNFKKRLQFNLTYGIIFRHAAEMWRKKTCVDAGGGPSRMGKFPRSMSDFKPGERIRST